MTPWGVFQLYFFTIYQTHAENAVLSYCFGLN